VSRLNFRFQEEVKMSFELRIKKAKVNRDKAEITLSYAYQVEHMNSPTPSLSVACINGIRRQRAYYES
jgi:hypothetical protein